MSQLAEVSKVVQRPGEPARRWFQSETLDVQLWLDDSGAPIGFQLAWRDGSLGRAITAHAGQPLLHEQVDEGGRGGKGVARSALLHAVERDFDLALILPRFAAASAAMPEALRRFVLDRLGGEPETQTPIRLSPLAGQVVLVTRPLRQSRPLVAALEAAGAVVRLLPLLAIRPVPDTAAVTALLRAEQRADAWLFTSANAVTVAARLLDPQHWQAPVFAVGAATARALAAVGHIAQRPPPDAIHSEGLLSLPALQAVAGKRVLIITGEGGRDGLREPLLARRAVVQVATVYRREGVPHLPETIEATLEGLTALIVTSGESLVALDRALPKGREAEWRQQPVVVPSRRVEGMARLLGYRQPLLAPTVSDEAFVQALMDHCRA